MAELPRATRCGQDLVIDTQHHFCYASDTPKQLLITSPHLTSPNDLMDMINTMLDISEADTGTERLSIEKIDIAALVRDTCELFEPIAEDKGVNIIQRLPDSCYIYGDVRRLQRMVANLLDNALKYTPSEGTITVSVNGNNGRTLISVNDTGIGISEDELPRIFDRFYRCDQSRSQAGIGLGLSLALAIARAHSGDITATSYPGKGNTFTAILPPSPLFH